MLRLVNNESLEVTTGSPRLVLVPVGVSFASVSAGAGGHACGLTPAGDAYCWGFNGNGQLGDGTRTERWVPTRVVQ